MFHSLKFSGFHREKPFLIYLNCKKNFRASRRNSSLCKIMGIIETDLCKISLSHRFKKLNLSFQGKLMKIYQVYYTIVMKLGGGYMPWLVGLASIRCCLNYPTIVYISEILSTLLLHVLHDLLYTHLLIPGLRIKTVSLPFQSLCVFYFSFSCLIAGTSSLVLNRQESTCSQS